MKKPPSEYAHFIYDKYGRVIDLLDIDMEAVKKACHLAKNALPQHVSIIFGGICSHCFKTQ